MHSEIEDVVLYSDISFNSEISTIRLINEKAQALKVVHKIVLMFDLGDLREGYFYEEDLYRVVEHIIAMSNIKLVGIATNLTCYGAIIPSKENLSRLVSIAKNIEERFSIKLDIVSGGNSSSIHLLTKNDMPNGINNLRIGEAILLGRETAYEQNLENCFDDAFILECQIVELKEKPSIPIGEQGVDAFGNKPVYEDRGIIKRAIIAIGKQDIVIDGLIPLDEGIEVIGGSSDHTILDLTNSRHHYEVGDILLFKVNYAVIMSAFSSNYIIKEVIK